MIEWLENQVQALNFLWQNPGILFIALLILIPLYWVQGKLFRPALTTSQRTRFGGVVQPAGQAKRIRDIGIGVQTILVLKLVKIGLLGIVLALGFVGALAAFMGLIVLQEVEGQAPEN